MIVNTNSKKVEYENNYLNKEDKKDDCKYKQ